MVMRGFLVIALTLLALPGLAWAQPGESRPADIVDAGQVVDGLLVDMRYYGQHNFLGVRVDGYLAPKCLLTKRAAQALAAAQADLKPFGLGLKVYDCYRPKQAVAHFVRWAKDTKDTKAKKEFYSTVDKSRLFDLGYIAYRSGHSRGSTVDLTIVPLDGPAPSEQELNRPVCECFKPRDQRSYDSGLDMGGNFDCFHEVSHTANPGVGLCQRINRLLLKTLMEKHGFVNYDKEWWHYTLADEPYPDTYFDFPVN